jgi:hypothetical protein
MRVARTLILTSVLVPALLAAQSQPRPIVIRASTVLDGKGAILRDVAIVVEGGRIARIDSNVAAATYSRHSTPGRSGSSSCATSAD